MVRKILFIFVVLSFVVFNYVLADDNFISFPKLNLSLRAEGARGNVGFPAQIHKYRNFILYEIPTHVVYKPQFSRFNSWEIAWLHGISSKPIVQLPFQGSGTVSSSDCITYRCNLFYSKFKKIPLFGSSKKAFYCKEINHIFAVHIPSRILVYFPAPTLDKHFDTAFYYAEVIGWDATKRTLGDKELNIFLYDTNVTYFEAVKNLFYDFEKLKEMLTRNDGSLFKVDDIKKYFYYIYLKGDPMLTSDEVLNRIYFETHKNLYEPGHLRKAMTKEQIIYLENFKLGENFNIAEDHYKGMMARATFLEDASAKRILDILDETLPRGN